MKRQLLIAVGVAIGIGIALLWRDHRAHGQPPAQAQQGDRRVKEAAWAAAAKRMAAAEKEEQELIDAALKAVKEFFDKAKKGSPAFAGDLLSLKGKALLLKSKVADPEAHRRYMAERFEARLFKSKDLEGAIQEAVTGHQSSLDGVTNQLLVDLRADIESIPSATLVLPAAQTDQAFAAGFRKASTDLTPALHRDLKETAVKEVAAWVAGDIAANIALRVTAGIAARLGIGGGGAPISMLAKAGAFGVIVAAGIVADILLDKALKAAGRDPARDVAKRVDASLDTLRDALIEGHPDAVKAHAKAQQQAKDGADAKTRESAAKKVKELEASGALGLRRELKEYTQHRAAQRRAVLEGMLLGK